MRETAGASCGFLVATRGEGGVCLRPEGCHPDLATIRTAEMESAAKLFGGSVWFANCPDASATQPEEVLLHWEREAGGSEALLRRFSSVISDFAPDRIVTFDPRHGCTWHADHRAIGMLVQRLALPFPVTLAESRINFCSPLTIERGRSGAKPFDSRATWHYLVDDLACHRSQMTEAVLDLFRNLPEEQRATWLLHRSRWTRWSRAVDFVEQMTRRSPGLRHFRKMMGFARRLKRTCGLETATTDAAPSSGSGGGGSESNQPIDASAPTQRF